MLKVLSEEDIKKAINRATIRAKEWSRLNPDMDDITYQDRLENFVALEVAQAQCDADQPLIQQAREEERKTIGHTLVDVGYFEDIKEFEQALTKEKEGKEMLKVLSDEGMGLVIKDNLELLTDVEKAPELLFRVAQAQCDADQPLIQQAVEQERERIVKDLEGLVRPDYRIKDVIVYLKYRLGIKQD